MDNTIKIEKRLISVDFNQFKKEVDKILKVYRYQMDSNVSGISLQTIKKELNLKELSLVDLVELLEYHYTIKSFYIYFSDRL